MANTVVEGPRLKDEAPGVPVLESRGGQTVQVGWQPLAEKSAARSGSMVGDYDKFGLDQWPPDMPSGWAIFWSPVFNKDDPTAIDALEQVRLPGTSDAIAKYTDPRREVPLEFIRWVHPKARAHHVCDRFLKVLPKDKLRRMTIKDFRDQAHRINLEAQIRAERSETEEAQTAARENRVDADYSYPSVHIDELMADVEPVPAELPDPYEEIARMKAELAEAYEARDIALETVKAKAQAAVAQFQEAPLNPVASGEEPAPLTAAQDRMAKARAAAAANRAARKAAQEAGK